MVRIAITEAAYAAVVETLAKGVAIVTLAALAVTGPAFATEPDPPLVAKARRAAEMTKDAAPEFGCYDQTDPETCQQVRIARGDGGIYVTQTYASGLVIPCFEASQNYRVCVHTNTIEGEIFNGHQWVSAPKDDPRCKQWRGPFTPEYLACEAALPPKQAD